MANGFTTPPIDELIKAGAVPHSVSTAATAAAAGSQWLTTAFQFLGTAGWVLQIASSIYSFVDARKQAKRQAEQRRESRALRGEIQLSDMNQRMPFYCGRVVFQPMSAYIHSASKAPTNTAMGLYTPGNEFIGELITPGGYSQSEFREGRDANEFLLQEDILCIRGNLGALYVVEADGNSILWHPAEAREQSYAGQIVYEIASPGEVAGVTKAMAAIGKNSSIAKERGPSVDPKYPMLVHTASIAHNYTSDPISSGAILLHSIPKVPDFVAYGVGAHKGVERSGNPGSYTYAFTANTQQTNRPQDLLMAIYSSDDIMGFGIEAKQDTLQSIYDSYAYWQAVMQGKDGLDDETYPAEQNTFEGTSFTDYEAAFKDKGFLPVEVVAPAGGKGMETGWVGFRLGEFTVPAPVNQATQKSDFGAPNLVPFLQGMDIDTGVVKSGMLDSRIRRAEFNGFVTPGQNAQDAIASIMQTMIGAVFPRSMATGNRVLRYPRGDIAEARQSVGTITEDEILELTIQTPNTDFHAGEVVVSHKNALIEDDEDTSIYPQPKYTREETDPDDSTKTVTVIRDTPAREKVLAQDGIVNTTTLSAAGVDNRYHGSQIAKFRFHLGRTDDLTIDRLPTNNRFYEVGEIVKVEHSTLTGDVFMFIIGEAISPEFIQRLRGWVFKSWYVAWHVAQRYQAETRQTVDYNNPIPAPERICAEYVAHERVVLLDLDCEVDSEGNVVPRATPTRASFPRGFPALIRVVEQQIVRTPLDGLEGGTEDAEGNATTKTYSLASAAVGVSVPSWATLVDGPTLLTTNPPNSAVGVVSKLKLVGVVKDKDDTTLQTVEQPFDLVVVAAERQFAARIHSTGGDGVFSDANEHFTVRFDVHDGAGRRLYASAYGIDGPVPTNGTYSWTDSDGNAIGTDAGETVYVAPRNASKVSGPYDGVDDAADEIEFAFNLTPGQDTTITCTITDNDTAFSVQAQVHVSRASPT